MRLPAGWAAYSDEVLPGYASFHTKEAGLPDMRPRRHARVPAGAVFAEPTVETVDPSAFRAYLTDTEWYVVEVLVDEVAFENRVLKDEWRDLVQAARDAVRPVRLCQRLINDLRVKGYFVHVSDDSLCATKCPVIPCNVFAVVKSDRTLRLIWNGIPFNHMCRPPPRFRITPLHEMLQRLLHPGVKWFYAFDFRTWFLQLRCNALVGAWFSTDFGDAKRVRLCGVPMGWAWACVAAHVITVAFTRAVLKALGPDIAKHIVAEWCIDNTIFAISTDDVSPQQITDEVERVAARFGVVVKRSATEHGRSVDWLVYKLDAQTRTAVFKQEYCERIARVVRRTRRGGMSTMSEMWSVIGFVVFTCYAARHPLTDVKWLLEWLAETAPPPEAMADWGAKPVPVFPFWRLLNEVARGFEKHTVAAPPCPRTLGAWVVSDAATTGNSVALVFLPTQTRLSVYRCQGAIAPRELCATVRGASMALDVRAQTTGKAIVLYGDNEPARAAAARGYALWADPELHRRFRAEWRRADAQGCAMISMRVDTHRCLADAWTRKDAAGLLVPVQERVFPRTCEHEFRVGVVCACVRAQLAGTGVDMNKFDAWQADPPPRPRLPVEQVRSPLVEAPRVLREARASGRQATVGRHSAL